MTRHARTNYRALLPFIRATDDNGGYKQWHSPFGYMPLSMESLHYVDFYGDDVYSMSHITVQNGDLMRDPEMEFSVNHQTGSIRPLTYRNDFLSGYRQEVFESRTWYRPRLLTELDDFLWRWCKDTIKGNYKID